MKENKSVMNSLMHIGGAIAEASKKNHQETPAPAAPFVLDETDGAGAAEPHPEVRREDGEILRNALHRRYDELQRMRAELISQLEEETAKIQSGLRKKEELLRALGTMRETLRNAEQDFDCLDQSKLAAECRSAENVRLGLIRLAPQLSAEESAPENKGTQTGAHVMHELRSLTFSQLAGAGTAFLLPLILTVIAAAVLISAAIILSINGMFVW